MATHSRILAWKIPWREKPGGLQSMESKKSDMTEHIHMFTCMFMLSVWVGVVS